MARMLEPQKASRLLPVLIATGLALLLAAAPLSAATDPAALPESAARSSTRYGDGVLQQGPEELRGEVTSVVGDRIHIRISEAGWLPRAGTAVDIGAEMSGMWQFVGNFRRLSEMPVLRVFSLRVDGKKSENRN